MRRSVVIGSAAVALALLFLGLTSLMAPPSPAYRPDPEAPPPAMVTFEDASSSIWPFLSPSPTYRQHSPLNVFVLNATLDDVVQLMGDKGWNRTVNETGSDASDPSPEEETAEFVSTNITWGHAEGAHRYGYIHDGEAGRWKHQDTQLHHGDYFGHRLHMRLFASPHPGEWVAIQVHTEHFDWFTLRHAVDGVHQGQVHVEQDFMGQPFVKEVWRKHVGNQGPADADGWATVIELAIAPSILLFGSISWLDPVRRHITEEDRRALKALKDRLSWDHLFLAASILSLILGVRLGAIALERNIPRLDPFLIAGSLFPILAIGIPLAAYGFARRLEHRMDAAVVAGAATALASLVDYGFLQVDTLPMEIILHRFGVVLAVALLAAGAARRATRERHLNALLLAGSSLWGLLWAATLFGWV
ncbi:MAG: hypothetical protein R3185_06015 [Candidatus Thermoplasmatota archaeon]|nr:hypothetical protein [Candidatus Thermoplasmatota archaeon]